MIRCSGRGIMGACGLTAIRACLCRCVASSSLGGLAKEVTVPKLQNARCTQEAPLRKLTRLGLCRASSQPPDGERRMGRSAYDLDRGPFQRIAGIGGLEMTQFRPTMP